MLYRLMLRPLIQHRLMLFVRMNRPPFRNHRRLTRHPQLPIRSLRRHPSFRNNLSRSRQSSRSQPLQNELGCSRKKMSLLKITCVLISTRRLKQILPKLPRLLSRCSDPGKLLGYLLE